VAPQNPVRLGEDSEPEPDVAVLRPRADRYKDSHPTAADVLLVIEVADTSLEFDRSTKISLYARHGIPEVWLFDLVNRLFSVYREPKDGIYRNVQTTGTLGTIELSQLPGATIDLSGLL
jgi:Uma2 family endonuclease